MVAVSQRLLLDKQGSKLLISPGMIYTLIKRALLGIQCWTLNKTNETRLVRV